MAKWRRHQWAISGWATAPTGVVSIAFGGDEPAFVSYIEALTGQTAVANAAQVAPLQQALAEYFAGQRTEFDLPLRWDLMTAFQQRVLRHVYAIPYGQVRTYGDIATELGGLGQARAVGRANATNPIPIIVPCHRVLGSDGKLHGYGGGLENKAWLLRLEGSWLL